MEWCIGAATGTGRCNWPRARSVTNGDEPTDGFVTVTRESLRFFIVNTRRSPSRTWMTGPGTEPPNVHAE